MLSEISETEKDKNHKISLIWGIERTKENQNRLIDTETQGMATSEKGDGGWVEKVKKTQPTILCLVATVADEYQS